MKKSVLFFTFASFTSAIAIASQAQSEIRAPAFASFEQWAEGIIAHPDAKHLTPEEAINAHKALMSDPGRGLESKALEQRDWAQTVDCRDNMPEMHRAPGRDVVAVIQYLAGLGDRDCTVYTYSPQTFKIIGHAYIYGQQGGSPTLKPKPDSCKNVARALGRIMDVCWRADDTVKGWILTVNGSYGVWISGYYPRA